MTLSPMLADLLRASLYGALACTFAAVNALFLVWLERKVSAKIQLRRGPMRGPFGLMQTLFDAIKLLSKELTTPRYASRFLFVLAPVLVFAPVVVSFLVIPFAPGMPIKDLNIGFLLVFAMSSIGFIGFFTAGWSSNNKYAALGSLRAVAQNISYEVPLLLSVMGIVLLAGTLQMSQIVAAQTHVWYIVLQPVAFLIFICAILGETNRAPFDIPEAESELIAGFHTEYSGFRFAVFFLTEYANVFIGSALAVALFLGGWHGPLIHPAAWFLLKTYLVVFVLMWVRWTFPRLRSDQLIRFGWKYLIPFGLLNVLVTALAMALIEKSRG